MANFDNILAGIITCLLLTSYALAAGINDINKLKDLYYSLPSPLAYYPLGAKFLVRDGSNNTMDGNLTSNIIISTTGPFNEADSASEMGPTFADDRFIRMISSKFSFGRASWTMSVWVNPNDMVGPILEFVHPDGRSAAHLWFIDKDRLFTDTIEGIYDMHCSTTGWQFVAWVYNADRGAMYLFCDDEFGRGGVQFSARSYPHTTNQLLVGARLQGNGISKPFQFACLQIYRTALNDDELRTAKSLCSYYASSITCANCGPDSCRADMEMPMAYKCGACEPGWTGSDCSQYFCEKPCQNSGTCTGPNICGCTMEWEGTLCDVPKPQLFACDKPCQNGGTCIAQNACSCRTGWSGSICQEPDCGGDCPEQQVCVGPSTCSTRLAENGCRVIPEDFNTTSCQSWKKTGMCLISPSFMWSHCGKSCSSYATCECSAVPPIIADRNCTCGNWASLGLCETDPEYAKICPYTCGRRVQQYLTCSAQPLHITTPDHAKWIFQAPAISYFLSRSAYMTSARLECDRGYFSKIAGDNALHICDPFTFNSTSGNWLQVGFGIPVCLPLPCKRPAQLYRATVLNLTSTSQFYFGDRVKYKCLDGYISNGASPYAYCSLNTSSDWYWEDTKLECILPPCQRLQNGVNAYFDVFSNVPGGVAIYHCFPGYSPVGNRNLFVKTCAKNGTWTPEGIPSCSVIGCSEPVSEEFSYIEGEKDTKYVYGDEVTYYCQKGAKSVYLEPGSETEHLKKVVKKCGADNLWSAEMLKCLAVKCPKPEPYETSHYNLINGSTVLSNLLYNQVILFECDWTRGYEPIENQSSNFAVWRCTEDTTWEKEDLRCTRSGLIKWSSNRHLSNKDGKLTIAVATGTTILSFLSFLFAIIICLDYLTMSRDIQIFRHNIKHFYKRFRDASRVKELKERRQILRLRIAKEIYLRKVEDLYAAQKLASSGLTARVISLYGRKMPFGLPLSVSPKESKVATFPYFSKEPDIRVEGKMELPENIELPETP